jgi:hypothetical protein
MKEVMLLGEHEEESS